VKFHFREMVATRGNFETRNSAAHGSEPETETP
jgi:hypothetical protein